MSIAEDIALFPEEGTLARVVCIHCDQELGFQESETAEQQGSEPTVKNEEELERLIEAHRPVCPGQIDGRT